MAKTKQKPLRKYIHHQHRKYFSRFNDPQSILASFKTSISYSVKNFASSVKTPTLLIAGELDDITPVSRQKMLAKQFPDAKLSIIKEVGHLTHYETPDQVASLIRQWIK